MFISGLEPTKALSMLRRKWGWASVWDSSTVFSSKTIWTREALRLQRLSETTKSFQRSRTSTSMKWRFGGLICLIDVVLIGKFFNGHQ